MFKCDVPLWIVCHTRHNPSGRCGNLGKIDVSYHRRHQGTNLRMLMAQYHIAWCGRGRAYVWIIMTPWLVHNQDIGVIILCCFIFTPWASSLLVMVFVQVAGHMWELKMNFGSPMCILLVLICLFNEFFHHSWDHLPCLRLGGFLYQNLIRVWEDNDTISR